ncbi:uncharacterized protein LOC130973390 [Arachis stenosperma]|uniref:uncharacterized protein LOC130973390 n=1 Tax=Arachis stenosperma TaxID=217475 RepID=UPI0025AD6343|nr:uncharacterized protein LOC130973390 [Arachis stenosperma]
MAQQVPDPSPYCLIRFMEDDHINPRGKRIRDDQQDKVTKTVWLEQHYTSRDFHFAIEKRYLPRSISDSALWEQKRRRRDYMNSAGSEIGLEKEVESDRKMILPIIRCSHTNLNQHKHKNKNKKTKQIKPMVVCEENDEEVESYPKKVPCFVMLLMICVWGWLLTCRRETITIGGSVVELLSFMVFASGAALTILFGERFSHTHGAIFISWAVLMHVGVDHSISLLFLAILALFFGASHALSSFFTHNNNQIQQHILTSIKIVKPGGLS